MKTLVTGASGFIGSHLVELLLKNGHAVRCLLRTTSSKQWLENLPVEYVYGDLFDMEALGRAVDGVDIIFHSAGLTKARNAEEYRQGNTVGTHNIVQAAVSCNPKLRRFVHVSTQAAAGPSPTPAPIGEDVPAHPITTYGRTKWKAEEEVMAVAGKISVTIVRPPVVYGPRDKDVYAFFKTIKGGLQPVVGFGEKYVTLVHVQDLIRGFVMAAESEKAAGQTYFIGAKEYYGWREIGEIVKRSMGKRVVRLAIPEPVVYVVAAFAEFPARISGKAALINWEKARDMVQNYWTCDSSKAKRDFGYEAQISLEEGMRETVAWYRAHGWL